MKLLLIYLISVLAIAGCHAGPQIEDFEQAWQPEGIGVSIKLDPRFDDRKRVEGELLEVRRDGLLVNSREPQKGYVVRKGLVFVSYSVMRNVEVEDLNLNVVSDSYSYDDEDSFTESDKYSGRIGSQREQLRLLSRFPQGLSQSLLEEMLKAEGQRTVDIISSK